MKTARLKKELVVPGYWHYFVNHRGENDACWIPPCKYPADTEFEVVKEGIADGLEDAVRAPRIPDGTHVAICRWDKCPATKDQIGMAEMFVVSVDMLEIEQPAAPAVLQRSTDKKESAVAEVKLRVCLYRPLRFMYGHYADIEIVAERLGLNQADKKQNIRHHVDAWYLTDEQVERAEEAGATSVTRVDMDAFFHPEDSDARHNRG